MFSVVVLGLAFAASALSSTTTPHTPPILRPIVIWHGMGDSCCNPLSLGGFSKFLHQEIPGVYVKSLEIGNGIVEDTINGFFLDANKQVEEACRIIRSDPQLSDGFNALGFSQGGQFLRALVQRCPGIKIKNLITFGAQHQGVYGLPHCLYPDHKICDYLRHLVNDPIYWSWLQRHLVQAQYWHDPNHESLYKEKSTFLADINSENSPNETYINRLTSLEKFVMVMFTGDTMVEPKETSWFQFYKEGQATVIQPFKESNQYVDNMIGLRTMMDNGQLEFLSSPGNHLQFTEQWFITNIKKYLI